MKKPSKAFSSRFETAKKWRNFIRPSIEEVYKFTAPGREHDFTNPMKHTEVQNLHSLPEELTNDLASDLVSYYTPPEAIWADYSVITEVPENEVDAVKNIVSEREKDLFDLIGSSNYNDIAPQWGFEAASHGTPALWISQGSVIEEMHFEVVPPNELYITLGYKGILDRFREISVIAETLEYELEMSGVEIDLSSDKIQRKMSKPGETVKVIWGFWVDWSDRGNPQWKMEITVDGELVTEEEVIIGPLRGACPLHVGRFNPWTGRPWGRGAGMKALPDMRTLDEVEEMVLTAMEDTLKDTLIYPDDGFVDLSEGIERGKAYPASRGFTRDRIYEMEKSPAPDAGYYQEDKIENRLRTAFYQDGPRQTGDTPPSATQWIDERRRVQQRIGKPSAPLWTEFFLPIIQRVEYLGMESNRIPEALSHNGMDIKVKPISPLQKAQNSDKVMTTRSNLDLAFNIFQEQTPSIVDGIKTFQKIVDASGDELLTLQEVQANEPPSEPSNQAGTGN